MLRQVPFVIIMDNKETSPPKKQNIRKLNDEELKTLFIEFRKTGDEKIRDQLITLHVSFVLPLALKYRRKNIHLDDLIQVGMIGLIKAVDNFKPEKNVKFITYATHCIAGEIKHYIRDKSETVKMPRRLKKISSEVAGFIEGFIHDNNRNPTIEEISKELNISEDNIIEILKNRPVLSLNYLAEKIDERVIYQKIDDTESENEKLSIEEKLTLRKSINKLIELEKKIIYLFFYKDLTQNQIAGSLGVSQKKVSRMLRKALDKLKGFMSGEKILLFVIPITVAGNMIV
ncbi:MAG: sigma-70 family RNA polymerase sigma factor [Vulcanimicrobiota bacterium]